MAGASTADWPSISPANGMAVVRAAVAADCADAVPTSWILAMMAGGATALWPASVPAGGMGRFRWVPETADWPESAAASWMAVVRAGAATALWPESAPTRVILV